MRIRARDCSVEQIAIFLSQPLESGAALDAERAPQYIQMLRAAADAIGADRVLLVSHVPSVVEMCDARLELSDGEARWA